MWFWAVQVFLNVGRFGMNNEEGTRSKSEPVENPHWFVSDTDCFAFLCSLWSHNFSKLLHLRNQATVDSFRRYRIDKSSPKQRNNLDWNDIADGQNLTWINMTVDNLATGAIVKMTNEGKLYSHPFLGVPDAEVVVDGKTVDFRCSEHCTYGESIEVEADSSKISIQSLTSTDPARRSNGTVFADDISRSRRISKTRFHTFMNHLKSSSKLSNQETNLFNHL